jgi:hypothetical protein
LARVERYITATNQRRNKLYLDSSYDCDSIISRFLAMDSASSSTPSKEREGDVTAEIAKNLTLTYFDTGKPKGKTSYQTYLFIHGICHNKSRCFYNLR